MPHASRNRRELAVCLLLAAGIIALQSFVPLTVEQYFDSDQAITGLMAKHLSEGRAFPLFFYGQHYLLAVQAWLAVPFFWVGGPTVAMLRMPVVLFNLAVAWGYVWFLWRLGLQARYALLAALPVIAFTPAKAMEFAAVYGTAIEPFLYVLLLWIIRRRPVAFGALLGFGTLHREFTFLALPALALACWREPEYRRPASLVGRAAGFLAVWVIVDILKRNLNTFGPSGGAWTSGSVALGPQTLASWLSFDPAGYLARVWQMITWGLPDMFGTRAYAVSTYGIPGNIQVGSAVLGAVLAVTLSIATIRSLWLRREPALRLSREWTQFVVYLSALGIFNILLYGLNKGIDVNLPPVLRYALFAPLLLVAVFAAYFVRERSRLWRTAVAAGVVLWAAGNVVDNARLAVHLDRQPPPRLHRQMADYLVARGVRFARATYWDAYVITFLSRERVIVDSTTIRRISAYQAEVDAHASEAVTLKRTPCDDGRRVAAWCVVE